MKTKLALLAMVFPLGLPAQTASVGPGSQTASQYSVVSAGPNERVWQSITVDKQGNTNITGYTEIGTGLNFFVPGPTVGSGSWQLSQDKFFLTSDGYAIATNGQHKVILSPDIAVTGPDMLTPDGTRLVSQPICLAFSDNSGKSIIIAEVTNSIGQLVEQNVVLYDKAFHGLLGGISYTYTVVAVTHTDEPGGGWNVPGIYFGLWQSGKNLAICAWNSTNTAQFQAVGDPFVTR